MGRRLSLVLWPALVAVPVCYPRTKTHVDGGKAAPTLEGFFVGIAAVLVGQVFVLMYYYMLGRGSEGAQHTFVARLWRHVSRVEGFALLGTYLAIYWFSGLMPSQYYAMGDSVEWSAVLAQLIAQDVSQYLMHVLEHKVGLATPAARLHTPTRPRTPHTPHTPDQLTYKWSHYKHHEARSPTLFDSFNGSVLDTTLMILFPLLITSRLVSCNTRSYMAFGTIYANALCLIHSEYEHAWEPFFAAVGIGTSRDHHMHHRLFNKNYGHLFMYADHLCGTYFASSTRTGRSKKKELVRSARARGSLRLTR